MGLSYKNTLLPFSLGFLTCLVQASVTLKNDNSSVPLKRENVHAVPYAHWDIVHLYNNKKKPEVEIVYSGHLANLKQLVTINTEKANGQKLQCSGVYIKKNFKATSIHSDTIRQPYRMAILTAGTCLPGSGGKATVTFNHLKTPEVFNTFAEKKLEQGAAALGAENITFDLGVLYIDLEGDERAWSFAVKTHEAELFTNEQPNLSGSKLFVLWGLVKAMVLK